MQENIEEIQINFESIKDCTYIFIFVELIRVAVIFNLINIVCSNSDKNQDCNCRYDKGIKAVIYKNINYQCNKQTNQKNGQNAAPRWKIFLGNKTVNGCNSKDSSCDKECRINIRQLVSTENYRKNYTFKCCIGYKVKICNGRCNTTNSKTNNECIYNKSNAKSYKQTILKYCARISNTIRSNTRNQESYEHPKKYFSEQWGRFWFVSDLTAVRAVICHLCSSFLFCAQLKLCQIKAKVHSIESSFFLFKFHVNYIKNDVLCQLYMLCLIMILSYVNIVLEI